MNWIKRIFQKPPVIPDDAIRNLKSLGGKIEINTESVLELIGRNHAAQLHRVVEENTALRKEVNSLRMQLNIWKQAAGVRR